MYREFVCKIETENKYSIFSNLVLCLLSLSNTYNLKFYLFYYLKKENYLLNNTR